MKAKHSLSLTLVSNDAAEFNEGHFRECLRGHTVAIESHNYAFLLVNRRLSKEVGYTNGAL